MACIPRGIEDEGGDWHTQHDLDPTDPDLLWHMWHGGPLPPLLLTPFDDEDEEDEEDEEENVQVCLPRPALQARHWSWHWPPDPRMAARGLHPFPGYSTVDQSLFATSRPNITVIGSEAPNIAASTSVIDAHGVGCASAPCA